MTKRSVAIVTDSTADLPPALAAARSVTVVPLTLNFDGQSLLDGVDITATEFYRRLPGATIHPTTSQPSPGRFAETYKALLQNYESIVSLHISEKLSGTVASARQGADMADPQRIRVIDSEVASMSLGLMTLVASTLAARGADPEAIEAKLIAMRPTCRRTFRSRRSSSCAEADG